MIRFALVAFVLGACLLIVAQTLPGADSPSHSILITGFLFVSTVTIYGLLIGKARTTLFTQVYLLSVVIKMGIYGAFILIIIFVDPAHATSNAVFFVVSYLLFTALEVGFLYRVVNR